MAKDRLTIDGLFAAAATLAQAEIIHRKNVVGNPSIREVRGGFHDSDMAAIFRASLATVEGIATERGWDPEGGWADTNR